MLFMSTYFCKMNQDTNKKVTMELGDLQLETFKCLFGHNEWE